MRDIENAYTPKSINLRDIPKDVYETLIEIQADLKKKCNCQKSLTTTIFSIIRQYRRDAEAGK